MRVMHTMGAAGPGGAETFFIRLMAALHRCKGVQVLPVVRHGSWAAGRLAALGIPYETAPFGGRFDFTTRRQLKALATAFQPAVIQSWMNRATRFMPVGTWVRAARMGGYYKLKYYINNVDYIIANTHDIIMYCRAEGWPETRLQWLPNFIPQPATGWQKRRVKMRKAMGLAPSAKVMLLAGRLHPVKGIDVAIRALAKLPKEVVLVVAGEGRERPALQKQVDDAGLAARVHFVGWVDDISPLASTADVWIVPSRVEPLGNVVLDAWAHTLPVVASRTAGPVSLIEDGSNGLLVGVDKAGELATAVARVLEDSAAAKAMAAAGHKVFRKRFSEGVVVKAYLDYYRHIAKGG